MLKWKKHYLITGTGGARTDFLMNWLNSCHPDFQNQYFDFIWSINVETGGTNSTLKSPFNVPFENDRIDQIDEMFRHYDPNLGTSLATKCHHYPWVLDEMIPTFLKEKTTTVSITIDDLSNEYKDKIIWEFLAKTFFRKRREELMRSIQFEIDIGTISRIKENILDTIMDILAHRYMKMYKSVYEHYPLHRKESATIKTVFVNYTQLIDIDGSDHVCDRLGLENTDYGRMIWKRAIAISHTPRSVNYLDHVWSLDEIKEHVEKLSLDKSKDFDPD